MRLLEGSVQPCEVPERRGHTAPPDLQNSACAGPEHGLGADTDSVLCEDTYIGG